LFSLRQFFYDKYISIESKTHELLYLFLEITRRCNLACLHCGSDCKAEGTQKTLTPESWFSIVDYVARAFSKDLVFIITGGEPLVCSFLPELGEKISRSGHAWGMVTNGFALDETILARLVSAGLKSLTISLDGTKGSHNFLRNSELAYDRAIGAISASAASGISIMDVVTCVYPSNLLELDSVAELLLGLNVRNWRLFRIFPKGRANNNPELQLNHEQSWTMIDWIRRNRERYKRRGLAIDFSCEGWFPFPIDRGIRKEPFFCRSGINIASVLCDGTVTGCTNNGSAFYEGNLARDDFKTLWNSGFAQFRNRSWMKKGLCGNCGHFRHCKGGPIHLREGDDESPAFCYMRVGESMEETHEHPLQ
jgi:radical SAM protein with 4Fe4S-binding SPASM domain